ncbi:hypothetical protein ABZ858_20195 [Streptomyces sp. NPDC047017]|uniref:hypothetical protein n=1 Tax=Streptomyces sp. NPDC047017 TaxID=3155024 RepID=UPI0033CE3848
MRPKLKSDVLYVPTDDGVHVFGAGADVALRGRAAARWLDRLAPHLDGRTELAELVRGLAEDKRRAVDALVRRLHAAGSVLDAAEDLPHGLTERELETYAAEIAFVEYYLDSAPRRFETYRDSSVVVMGAGPVFVSLVCSALHSGVRRLRAVRTAEAATDSGRLAELAAEALRRDPEQEVEHAAWSDAEEAAAARADVVLHVVSAGDAVDRAVRLDRLCRDSGALLVQGLVLDDVAWLGPCGPGWASAWARLGAAGPYRDGRFLGGPAAAVVAGHLGLAAFKARTGISGSHETELTRVDLETLRTSTHAFLPHPQARTAVRPEREAEFAGRVRALQAAGPVGAEEFSARAARCFDPCLGVLRGLDEGEFTQVPLNVTEAVRPTDDGGPRVFGAGTSFAEARRAAALRGLAAYAAWCTDPRRVDADATVWGWDVMDRCARRVPAAVASGLGPGVAARLGWDDAVADGVAQQCVRLAVADVVGGRARPVALDLARATLDTRAESLLGLLRAAGGTVRVADAGAALGVPVLVWWQEGRAVAATCGPQAVADGLEQVLLDRQSVFTGEPAYAPPTVPGVGAPPGEGSAAGARWPSAPGPERMVECLRARGLRPVAVPLDHDPAVHEVLPSLLRVVVLDD